MYAFHHLNHNKCGRTHAMPRKVFPPNSRPCSPSQAVQSLSALYAINSSSIVCGLLAETCDLLHQRHGNFHQINEQNRRIVVLVACIRRLGGFILFLPFLRRPQPPRFKQQLALLPHFNRIPARHEPRRGQRPVGNKQQHVAAKRGETLVCHATHGAVHR